MEPELAIALLSALASAIALAVAGWAAGRVLALGRRVADVERAVDPEGDDGEGPCEHGLPDAGWCIECRRAAEWAEEEE